MIKIKLKKLNELEETNSTKEKQKIIKEVVEKDQEVAELLRLALGERVYNVGKKTIRNALNINYDENYKDIGLEVEKYIQQGDKQTGLMSIGNSEEITFEKFKEYLNHLEDTQKESKQIRILKKIFNNVTATEGRWYARVLVKDLNSGAGIKTVNKALRKIDGVNEIQTFEVSLAEAIEMDGRHMEDLQELDYPIYGEPKRDGVRLVIRNVNSNGEKLDHIEAKTRNGKKVFVVDEILEEVEELMGDRLFSLDGEIVGPDFHDLMTQLRRKEQYDKEMDIHFVVFDIRYLDGNVTDLTQRERKQKMESIPFRQMSLVRKVDLEVLDNPDEVINYFNRVKNKFEEEGGMIKDPQHPYTNDRHGWYKLKPIKDLDLKIIDYDIADDGRYAGQVTSITVQDSSGILETDVGSGFTDEDRKKFTEMKENLVGKIAEIHFDSYSKGQNDDKYSLRFPRFICLRNDKEKAQEADINE